MLALVLLAAFVSRAVWITLPANGLIFDEAYYVNASRVILGWEVRPGAHYDDAPLGLDPNIEHPPLGKALMAASMAAFGDNGLGWRLPSLIAGMAALGALYLVVRAAGGSRWLGVLAVALLALDNLTLVHGRIGTLDMLALAPILAGAWLGLRGRWLAAGGLLAVGALVKLTAVLGLVGVLGWLAWERLAAGGGVRAAIRSSARPAGATLAGFVLILGAGLWALDGRLTTFSNPVDHLRHMVTYGVSLANPGDAAGCPDADSAPWQWLGNDCEITYFRVDVVSRAGEEIAGRRATIDFRGAMNPVLLGALPLAFAFAGWLAVRERSMLARWTIAWAAANYLPYVVLVLVQHRITYIYYFLSVVPALAVAIALLLSRAGLPRAVSWAYVAGALAGLAAYFPFRQVP
ncbi:MAG: glycosyltransferase family 39 protein [Chloroflexi bacterium]|nr:glycosyltransferase family 39 protein [Chloroflexota bacterium]